MNRTIALVGQIASGKGAVSKILAQRGFIAFSYGEEIGREVDRRGLAHERNIHSNVAEDLRRVYGTSILAQRVAHEIDKARSEGLVADNVLIDGLRHPDEIRWLREHYRDLLVIGVIAPYDLRSSRFLRRGRALDNLTLENFRLYDERDRGVNEPPFGNQADAGLLLADVILRNDQSFDVLEHNLDLILEKFSFKEAQQYRKGIEAC